jgi:NAD+ kinase
MKQIGIIYNPKNKDTVEFSGKLNDLITGKGIKTWLCSAWEPEKAKAKMPATDLVMSVGGDGTILRAAKAIVPEPTPLLGINLGKLGFLSEFNADEAIDRLPEVLEGRGWFEARAVLEVKTIPNNKTLYALNDVFVGRRSSARLVSVVCKVNGAILTTYRADGVIVATASGSTGYALAAGGPIIYPLNRDMVLQPVCPHLSFAKTMVLPFEASIELQLFTNHEGMISIDGQVEQMLKNEEGALMKISSHSLRFLRFRAENSFYNTLEEKLSRKIK